MYINDIFVNYIQYGEGKDVVLLHGWGQNIEMMDFIGKNLENVRVTILDLPGFGKTDEPKNSMNVDDYADFLHEFCFMLDIDNPILIGHSFGGRVAIKYASKYDVDKVALFGTPCIRHESKPTFGQKLYKVVKKTPFGDLLRKHIGSADYNNATPIMRETLVKVVNEDLLKDAEKISAPTLLFAGTKDTAVPYEDVEEQAKHMTDAAVITLEGTHYAYVENLQYVSSILNEFITPNKIRS